MMTLKGMSLLMLVRVAFIMITLASFTDISDAESGSVRAPIFKEIGVFNAGGNVKSVTIDGNYAYVSGLFSGLFIVDISDPTNPRAVASVDSAGFGPVTTTGEYLFASGVGPGFCVFDIAAISKPRLLFRDNLKSHPMKIYVANNYAYFIQRKDGLRVLDISNITNPIQLTCFATPGSVGDMAINGHYAYLADGHTKEDTVQFRGGFYIVDIGNPDRLSLAGRYDIGAHVQGICLSGRYCFLAAGDSGIYIMDIKKPDKLKLAGRVRTPNYAFNVRVYNDTMYAIQGGEGLGVYDIKSIRSVKLLTEFKVDGLIADAVRQGNYLYLAAGKAGMVIVESK